MEQHLLIVEIVALATGLTVIAIETVIIFLLNRHIKALESHLESTDQLIKKFEAEINHHLGHLNEHSHVIESMLKTICDHDTGLHDRIQSGIRARTDRVSADVKIDELVGEKSK